MILKGSELIKAISLFLTLWILADPAKAETYKFVTLEFPPLEYSSDKNVIKGAAVDIVRKIMSDLTLPIDIELLPWTRSLNLVKDGLADAIFTAYKNSERETYLEYCQEVLIDQVVSFYVKKDSRIVFDGDIKKLADYSIGIISTISYGEKFDQAKELYKLKTDRVDSLELNFKKLIAGRIDLLISNRFSASTELARMKLSGEVTELKVPLEVIPSYLAFSKKRKLGDIRDRFDRQLKAIKANGEYAKILAFYDIKP